ncbi:MAG: hypothetical protein A2087_13545 [Spirochaetes bacterium GWD1_61_31]|nr:MAG: hypothetical protein A2Y37_14255 [Spirochaetes bacterium GWB1_60_80]OHD42179.1 MAG: hypothetical protein A2087_13545 [Spirochaetes bacterium GWD1_61_31]OHD44509.1 MAG: hypothetical protein A2Y35_05095 [Spirochaetes bacterium GWE1_60_18]OHD59339.1 MAG: hypothetical protein A2Y32_08400 [Spirochaetes bacterium GWF1_60_12]HAP43164.1 hypothetical protein [Spirochaetaceae bacterium]
MQATGHLKVAPDANPADLSLKSIRKKADKAFGSLLDKLKSTLAGKNSPGFDDGAEQALTAKRATAELLPKPKTARNLAPSTQPTLGETDTAATPAKTAARLAATPAQTAVASSDASRLAGPATAALSAAAGAPAAPESAPVRPAARKRDGGDSAAESGLAALAGLTLPGQPPSPRPVAAATKATAEAGQDFTVSSTLTKEGRRISVVDMRLGASKQRSENTAGSADANPAGKPATGEGFAAAFDAGSHNPAAASLPRDPASGQWSLAADRPAAPTPSLAENLAAHIRQSGAADIVRAAQIVLQDADTGLIRLHLEPETLGKVKIELKIADKEISGKIVVDSDLAGQAFRDSLDALRDAFAAAGLETTALEVEVRQGGQQQAGSQADDDRSSPFYSRRLKDLDAAVPVLTAASRDGLLNVFV